MRRCIVVLLVLFISSCSLFSYVSNVAVGTLNDAFTFGIAENYDDLRSFGFTSTIETSSLWNSTISLSGITFRNNIEPSLGRRVDEIAVSTSREFPLYFDSDNPKFVTFISFSGGFYILGDIGFDAIQNRWHRLIGVEEVLLPYCNEGSASMYPHFGLNSRFAFFEKIPYYSYSSIVVEIEGDYHLAPLYKSRYSLGLSIGQLSSSENFFKVGAGFTQTFSLHQFPLLETTSKSESGIYVNLIGRLGLLRINYRLYTHSSRAYGGLVIGIFSNLTQLDNYYSSNDIIFSVGSELSEKNMYALSIRYAITPTLGVYTSNVFGTKILDYDEHTRQNTSKWHLGIDYELHTLKNNLLLPFVSVGAGFKRILVAKDGVIDEQRVSVLDNLSLLINGQLGVRLFHDGRLQLGSTIYGIEISGGLSLTMGKNVEEELPEYSLLFVDSFQPFVRVAIYSAGSL